MICGITYEPEIMNLLVEWKGNYQAARHFYDCVPFSHEERTIREILEDAKRNNFYNIACENILGMLKIDLESIEEYGL